jgi:N-methylhydantoinase B
MSYCCDRSRSVTWGINGGLPSIPHGVWLNRGTAEEAFLGSVFSSVAVQAGDTFERPSAGGGGLGDPLDRAPEAVLEDVIDGYVTIAGGARDYGVVITPIDPEIDEYEIDRTATDALRAEIRAARQQWLNVDPAEVAARFRDGELDTFDLLRRYGVVVDWGTGELLPNTTKQFRDLLQVRAAPHWG